MKKRLAALLLLLVLLGSAFTGVPLRFGESDCGMDSMTDMDCCKAARLQQQTPEVADAKLCCALICAQNGTTSPPNIIRVSPPSSSPAPLHPAVAQPLPQSSFLIHHIDPLHGPPNSGPTYLRNLALLI
jgi:hypothetical protein